MTIEAFYHSEHDGAPHTIWRGPDGEKRPSGWYSWRLDSDGIPITETVQGPFETNEDAEKAVFAPEVAILKAENERLRAPLERLAKFFQNSGASIAARWVQIPAEERLAIVKAALEALRADGG